MRGDDGLEEQKTSLNILFDVLMSITLLMSSITPFLTEHIYQNLRNGIDTNDKDLYQESIHFLQIPDVDEKLISMEVERRFKRMQSVIENGRLIRDRKNIPMKYPLRELVVVDANSEMLQDCEALQNYITEELNVLKMTTEADEMKYVIYNCEPDNRVIGQALKKKYDKNFKKKLAALTSDELKVYLKDGSLMI
jgi:isoleucyl-tRNA synthetase